MGLLDGMLTTSGEGNISWFGNRQEKLVSLIKEVKPEYVMELGFNMGHSAILICESIIESKNSDEEYKDKKVQFYIFDICDHNTVKPNFQILSDKFKEDIDFTLIEGDSLVTIPQFFKDNNIKFDFIEIDGNHSYDYVRADIMNSWNNVSTNGIIYVDDYRSSRIQLVDVDNGVDSLDWSEFDTDYTDGIFWGKKK